MSAELTPGDTWVEAGFAVLRHPSEIVVVTHAPKAVS